MSEAILVRRSFGKKLPELNNPGTEYDLLENKELIDQEGNKIVGNIPIKSTEDIIINGAEISIPSGYYSDSVYKSVNRTNINSASIEIDGNGLITASVSQSEGYIDGGIKNTTKQLTTKSATTIIPNTLSQTAVGANVYTTGDIVIDGDVNLAPENIKNGVNIFGVTGTLKDSGANSVLNKTVTEIDNDTATEIISYLFSSCVNLSYANLLACSSIGSYAFYGCTKLLSVTLPKCTSIDNYAFRNCRSLTTISIPKCTDLGMYAFYGCSKLLSISLPNGFNTIDIYTFNGCSNLMSLTLLNSSVVYLNNSNALSYTPMYSSNYTGKYGSIYVPASLVSSYKAYICWSMYKDRITAII